MATIATSESKYLKSAGEEDGALIPASASAGCISIAVAAPSEDVDLDRERESESGDKAAATVRHRRASANASMSSVLRRRLCWAFAFVVLCVAVGLIAASLRKVPSTEMGVQYNVHKKQLEDATKSGGLFLGPPGFRFIKFPSTYITVDLDDRTCVSNDGLLVRFSVTFQVRARACRRQTL